ncbi:hypothetical protein DFH08DRAFT_986692 [Mycena albidolilacea]|uniref:HD domain-containing protein n=1 Tax=Mycena albidolilacea TaxID=1033008 RepID=A0AAD7E9L5_9AGAR|nr:hypothetical protein DFH08DRAFT_986692 [Mycena albidolilacea]
MPFPKTFDAYVPSNPPDLFALANIKPDYVSLETLRAVSLDAAHAASYEYAKKITPHERSTHPTRCHYPALAILGLYHTCILHDLGWSTTAEGTGHLAAAMTFELHGGIMAFEHLQTAAPELDAAQVGDIVQSIVLHTSQWPSGQSSATKALISLSALLDVGGYDVLGPGSFNFLVNRKTVQEVEKDYPRGNFATEGVEVLQKEFVQKSDCLLSHFHCGPEEFLKAVRKDPIVPIGGVGEDVFEFIRGVILILRPGHVICESPEGIVNPGATHSQKIYAGSNDDYERERRTIYEKQIIPMADGDLPFHISVQRVSQSSIAGFVKYPGSGWATIGGYHGARWKDYTRWEKRTESQVGVGSTGGPSYTSLSLHYICVRLRTILLHRKLYISQLTIWWNGLETGWNIQNFPQQPF